MTIRAKMNIDPISDRHLLDTMCYFPLALYSGILLFSIVNNQLAMLS